VALNGGHGIAVVALTGRSRLLSEGCNRAGRGAAGCEAGGPG
jgi:hypothetical protein